MSFFEERTRVLRSTETIQLEYKKASHSTGEGDRYEERALALLFLRCLREGRKFLLSSNDTAGGKFDDLVLCWNSGETNDVPALFVQLKHKTSVTKTTILRSWLMKETDSKRIPDDFSLKIYHDSYMKKKNSLAGGNYTLILCTNIGLNQNAQHMFHRLHDPLSVPGMKFLVTGGCVYQLNQNNKDVKHIVQNDSQFMNHFYLLCNQSNCEAIKSDIYVELNLLLGADETCAAICETLCNSLRNWMNKTNVCITRDWESWLNVVDTYMKREVTACNSLLTRINYSHVATLQTYIRTCNPYWIKPPGKNAMVLSATKVHQAIRNKKHIMVSVARFRELEEKVLCCWGPFCRWLVLIDNEVEHSWDTLHHVQQKSGRNRCLIIISYKRDDSFLDKCKSGEVSDDSWMELARATIKLNSEQHSCYLQDLCNVESLKSLLDGKPEALVALSKLSGSVRMGQPLESLPDNHIPRQLRVRMCVRQEQPRSAPLLQIVAGRSRVIIVGKPGVGKSTMLLDVATQLKSQHPSWWILKIDLLKFSEVFDSCGNGVKASKDILFQAVYNEKSLGILEYALLHHCLVEYPRIVCLVDGFDEICPDYAEKCVQALEELAPRQGKLLVTTRPSVVGYLEDALGFVAHSLPAFSEDELLRFHGWRCSLIHDNAVARHLFKIPLFSKMYVELLKSGIIVHDIVSLYETLFESKFRRLYKEKWCDNLYTAGKRRRIDRERREHEKHLGFLALSHLLPRLEVPGLAQPSYIDKDDLVKAGVIYQFIDDKSIFIHRTFAEYFLGKLCFTNVSDGLCAKVYRRALSDGNLEFFVECFDRIACKGRPLLMAVLDGSESEVKRQLENGAHHAEEDVKGRTSLHLIAAYSRVSTILWLLQEHLAVAGVVRAEVAEEAMEVEEVVKVVEQGSTAESKGVASELGMGEASGVAGALGVGEASGVVDSLEAAGAAGVAAMALGAEDGLLGWTPLRYAAEHRRWSAVAALLETGAQLQHLGDFQKDLHSPQKLWDSFANHGYQKLFTHVLHKNESVCSLEIVEEIEAGVCLVCAEMDAEQYKEIMCKAEGYGHKEVVKLLQHKLKDIQKECWISSLGAVSGQWVSPSPGL